MLQPDNADLLRELKILAQDTRETAARVPLIKLGDEETIRSSLEALRSNEPGSRGSAVSQLSFAANPKIIPLLKDDLNQQESPAGIRVEDVQVMPVSMAAATVIRSTIIESPVFSPAVKEWAKRLPKVSAGLRDGVRAWLDVNQAAIERGDYQSVVPVEAAAQSPRIQAALPTPMLSASSRDATPAVSSSAPVVAKSRGSVVERKPPLWLWAMGIAALMVIVALAVKKGRNPRR